MSLDISDISDILGIYLKVDREPTFLTITAYRYGCPIPLCSITTDTILLSRAIHKADDSVEIDTLSDILLRTSIMLLALDSYEQSDEYKERSKSELLDIYLNGISYILYNTHLYTISQEGNTLNILNETIPVITIKEEENRFSITRAIPPHIDIARYAVRLLEGTRDEDKS